MKELLDFGAIGVKKLCFLIYLFGLLVVIISSVKAGYAVYLATFYDKTIQLGNAMTAPMPADRGVSVSVPSGIVYSSERVNNLPLGVAGGLVTFIIGAVLWRFVCEGIYIILNYFQKNTNQQEQS